jgi:hypothetical protein
MDGEEENVHFARVSLKPLPMQSVWTGPSCFFVRLALILISVHAHFARTIHGRRAHGSCKLFLSQTKLGGLLLRWAGHRRKYGPERGYDNSPHIIVPSLGRIFRFTKHVPAFVTVSKLPVGRLQNEPVVARRRNTDPGQSPAPRVGAQSDTATATRA